MMRHNQDRTCSTNGCTNCCAGCLTDVACLKYLLQKRFHFQDGDIRILTDDNPNPLFRPTKQSIVYWIGCAATVTFSLGAQPAGAQPAAEEAPNWAGEASSRACAHINAPQVAGERAAAG